MSLLCLDLDNTLVDRTGTYRRWAIEFVSERRLEPLEVGWLMEVDLDGFAERHAVFTAIVERYHLPDDPAELLRRYHDRVATLVEAPEGCVEALADAKARGWSPWVVTNGELDVQESKIRGVGLDTVLDGWVISAEAGIRKPNEAIFDLCASRAGLPLEGSWMIGDSGHADIAGAHNASMRSVWLHRNRVWDESYFAPTQVAASIIEALELIGAPERGGRHP